MPIRKMKFYLNREFNLKLTHFNQIERLSKLFALISLALYWAILIKEWLHEQIPWKIKKYVPRAKSIFRYGLNHLRGIVLDINFKKNLLKFYSKLIQNPGFGVLLKLCHLYRNNATKRFKVPRCLTTSGVHLNLFQSI